MNLRLLTATTALALSTVAFADSQFDRTLNVSSQPDLYVATGSGNIHIHPGNDTQIHIVGHVHAGWGGFGDVTGRVQRIVSNPPIQQDGNTVKIGAVTDHDLFNNITIDYDIAAPAGVALNLKSGSGDIETDHLGRYLTASSGSGNILAHGVRGAGDLNTGSGEIEFDQEAAGDIKARSGSGGIRIHGFNGTLIARTGSGDVEADGRLTGPANLSSGSGNIHLRLDANTHFNLEASTGSGDMRVRFPGAPQQDDHSRHHLTAPINGGGPALEVRTGSGDIEVASR
jgi:hypothetical protein